MGDAEDGELLGFLRDEARLHHKVIAKVLGRLHGTRTFMTLRHCYTLMGVTVTVT